MSKKKFIRQFCEIIRLKHYAIRREEVHIFREWDQKRLRSSIIYTALHLTYTLDHSPILKIFPKRQTMER